VGTFILTLAVGTSFASAGVAHVSSRNTVGQRHVIEQARAGGVSAVFSYYLGSAGNAGYSDLRVSIYRSGRLTLTSLLPFKSYSPLGRVWSAQPRPSIHVSRFSPSGEPAVIVDLYTGGVHCCADSLIYVYASTSHAYRRINHLWGNVLYQLRDLSGNGSLEFLSADAAHFAYAFDSFGGSFFPIQIWQLQGLALRDATNGYRPLIVRDAAQLWRRYLSLAREQPPDVGGVLAAWAADEARLGLWTHARTAIEDAVARGELDADAFVPASKYLAVLKQDLTRWGYLTGA
jgi:hypothetical protein